LTRGRNKRHKLNTIKPKQSGIRSDPEVSVRCLSQAEQGSVEEAVLDSPRCVPQLRHLAIRIQSPRWRLADCTDHAERNDPEQGFVSTYKLIGHFEHGILVGKNQEIQNTPGLPDQAQQYSCGPFGWNSYTVSSAIAQTQIQIFPLSSQDAIELQLALDDEWGVVRKSAGAQAMGISH